MNYIIGVDIGTTNSKAVAYSLEGTVLGQHIETYSPISPSEGYHELDPAVLFDAVCTVISGVVAQCASHRLVAFGFSSAMHGLIAVDKSGDPLTNMITWADLRSSAYARELRNTPAGNLLHEQTGTPNHAMSPLCKLMWMKDHLPSVFNNTHKFISIKEFVFQKFFGRYIVDRSVASSTGLLDIHSRSWNENALQLAGIDESRLSEHVAADYVISGMQKEYANQLGVDPSTPFVIGGSDGCMAHIGSNAIRQGDVSVTIGTSGAVRIMNRKPVDDSGHRIFNYLITDDLYLSGGPVNNGGNVLQWFSKHFLGKNFQSEQEIAFFINDALKVPEGSEGLVFLPYIYGERAPVWDAEARGIFFGVSAVHTISHFMRSAMEGVSFSLFSILHSIEEANGPANEIYASGGFIRSRSWVQMLADIFGKRMHVMHSEDSSAAGAAIVAMKALGIIRNWEEAMGFFREAELYVPRLELRDVYMSNFNVYSKLYDKFIDIKR
jgi:gluconokinase